METVVPRQQLYDLIAPIYPKPGKVYPQHLFGLSGPPAEQAFYGSAVRDRFAGIDLAREPAPDETTIFNSRHLLEHHGLCRQILRAVNEHLATRGLRISTGMIVDATNAHAPSSTTNEAKARDLEMHQTWNGNQWYSGMKAHIGVDSKARLTLSLVTAHDNCGAGKPAAWG